MLFYLCGHPGKLRPLVPGYPGAGAPVQIFPSPNESLVLSPFFTLYYVLLYHNLSRAETKIYCVLLSDRRGTALNYKVVGEAMSSMRCCACIDDDWKAEIEEDVAVRGE